MAYNDANIYSGLSMAGQVPREGLIKKMKAISREKNIFISAPGGYGKTIAATQWLMSLRGKKAKIIIGDADNDPGVLNKKIAAVMLKLTGKPIQMQDKSISFDRLLDVIKALPKKHTRCYVIVDECNRIKNDESLNRLPALLARLPYYVRICLISRLEPSQALLETGLFEMITKDDLLFSEEEVEWFGAEKGVELSTGQIKELLETTGGWAMHLTALLSHSTLEAQKNAKISLTQYLETQIWAPADHETKSLLLALAIPDEITPGLCGRLTGDKNAQALLGRLTKEESFYLATAGTEKDIYCFHDIFREFLLERAGHYLGKDEVRRLNDIAAGWYYEHGEYYAALKYHIENGDHDGITRCMEAANRYIKQMCDTAIEYNHLSQYLLQLPMSFIKQNPYLHEAYAYYLYLNGSMADFSQSIDALMGKLPEIAEKHPQLLETIGFVSSLDTRLTVIDHANRIAAAIPDMRGASGEADKAAVFDSSEAAGFDGSEDGSFATSPAEASDNREPEPIVASTNTITQNLPFFHRSMRDYSELYALKDEDLSLIRNTFGLLIGRDYSVMDLALVAGIHYERGELMDAAYHALSAYRACTDDMHPETIFCAYMILAAALFATGVIQEADDIMEQMERYIDGGAQFLKPNFKAIQYARAIRDGDIVSAREWLDVYACLSDDSLPFYQICRHFTTLRAYISIGEYDAAARFGQRLQKLAAGYRRPLDQIESCLLTSIALRRAGKQDEAVSLIEQAIATAGPFGFIQLFVNEGRDALPMLWVLQEKAGTQKALVRFTDKLIEAICKRYKIRRGEKEAAPELTPQQSAILSYLSKGMTYGEISKATGIGHGTVKSHVLLVYKKLGVHSAQEAVAKARAFGMFDNV